MLNLGFNILLCMGGAERNTFTNRKRVTLRKTSYKKRALLVESFHFTSFYLVAEEDKFNYFCLREPN